MSARGALWAPGVTLIKYYGAGLPDVFTQNIGQILYAKLYSQDSIVLNISLKSKH